MVAKNILEEFFDKKELAILKVFLFDAGEKFYLREVSKKSRIPVATTFRILRKLKTIAVLEELVIKKTKLYSLAQNKNTKRLSELFEEKKTILDEFIETVSQLPGLLMIASHGEDLKDRVSLFIIGNNLDLKVIKEKIGDIKDKYNFNIIELVLSPEQFNQMSLTGLTPDKKNVVWEISTTNA